MQRLPVSFSQERLRGIRGDARGNRPVPEIDLVLARQSTQREPRAWTPPRLDDAERTLHGLGAFVPEDRTPLKIRAVARPEHGLEERRVRREPQVARDVAPAGGDLDGGPRAHRTARAKTHASVIVRVRRRHARRVRAPVTLEGTCQAIVAPTRPSGNAEPVTSPQRSPERAALLEGIEPLHVVLHAAPRRLRIQTARAVAIRAVRVVQVYAAEIRGPRRGLGTNHALGVGVPPRATGASLLRVDLQDTAGRAGAVHRGQRGPAQDLDGVDVCQIDVVEAQGSGYERPLRARLEVVLRGVHTNPVHEHQRPRVAHQRLRAPQPNPRPHAGQAGPRDDEQTGDATRQQIREVPDPALPHERRRIDHGPVDAGLSRWPTGGGNLLLGGRRGAAIGRALGTKRPRE